MAENQDKRNENDDENDPYKFFKFAGPSDDNEKKDGKKPKDGKKRFPFWPIALITFLVIIVFPNSSAFVGVSIEKSIFSLFKPPYINLFPVLLFSNLVMIFEINSGFFVSWKSLEAII